VFGWFDRDVRVTCRSNSAMLVAVCLLEAKSLDYSCCLTKRVPRQFRSSPVPSPQDSRMAASLELVGKLDVATGLSTRNESLVIPELLRGVSARSSQLGMAPPQLFSRIRLRLLSLDDTSGTVHFVMARDNGTTCEAKTRETVNSNVIGKKGLWENDCRGDGRGGLNGTRELRALPLSCEPSIRTPRTFRLGTNI
jgi:hypothetical protein